MSDGAIRRMTADEFLEWDVPQSDGRHELVEGVPVSIAPAEKRHKEVIDRAAGELRSRLCGGPWCMFGSFVAVRIPNGNVRRPDAGVQLGSLDEDATFSAAPTMLLDVASSSARFIELSRKLEEYKTIPGLALILLLDPDAPAVILWTRDAHGKWAYGTRIGTAATIELPALAPSLRLSGIYGAAASSGIFELVISEPGFHSYQDEENFFRWIYNIRGYVDCFRASDGLHVTFHKEEMDRGSLYDLVGLFHRYNLDQIEQLRIFKEAADGAWFSDPQKYWHKKIFAERSENFTVPTRTPK